VPELLGHATIEMNMRYAHLRPEVKVNGQSPQPPQEHIGGHMTVTRREEALKVPELSGTF